MRSRDIDLKGLVMFWCEKENRWCSVWSCDREECEFVVRASDKERFYQCLTCLHLENCNLDEKSEDERGLCKEYRIDKGYIKRLKKQIVSKMR